MTKFFLHDYTSDVEQELDYIGDGSETLRILYRKDGNYIGVFSKESKKKVYEERIELKHGFGIRKVEI